MVEFESLNWEGWLEDAPFFPAKPNDSFNLDELLNAAKTGNDVDLVTGLPELDWLDAKVDTSIFNPNTPDDAEYINDAFNLLLDSVASNSDILCPSPEAATKVGAPEALDFNLPTFVNQDNFEIANFFLGSPSFYEPMSGASSPASYTSYNAIDPELMTSDDLCLSPQSTSLCGSPSELVSSDEFLMAPEDSSHCSSPRSSIPSPSAPAESFCPTINDILSLCGPEIDDEVFLSSDESRSTTTDMPEPPVSVKIIIPKETSASAVDETLSIEEVTASMRKRRFVSNGKDIPKVQVSLKNMFHPYEKPKTKRPRNRVERKKVQNKEAAARYRIKKRREEEGLTGDVRALESEQSELQKTHDSLVSEIKYLKSLMREILQKRGVLK